MSKIYLGKYQHYKGDFYEVLGVARHSETLEEFVLYRGIYHHPEYGTAPYWVRPKSMFLETVTVNGAQVPRFRYVG